MATTSLAEPFPEIEGVAAALRTASLTVAVAESCTGGLLGAVLTALPGSSDYMVGGVIAYADSVKSELLGVSRHELAVHGAVSEPVARAMAEGVRRRVGSDIGLSITGVAGPGGQRDGKPAGLVYVAAATERGIRVERLNGDHGREGNRGLAVRAALQLCRDAAAGLRPPPTG
jgi:nicotinamide-nucleotide amidase